MIETAKKYHAAGISVIPIAPDKVPRLYDGSQAQYAWKKHQSELVDPQKAGNFMNAWGIGIVAGKVSGNLECIDIDTKYDLTGKLYEEFKTIINDTDDKLLRKLVVQKTPSGGYHFLYRCSVLAGNQKIAMRHTTADEKIATFQKVLAKSKPLEEAERARNNDKVRVLIETRGEGGYFGVYPTKGYELVFGDITKLQDITPAERDLIFSCARTFNEVYEEAKIEKKHEKTYTSNKSPFEHYNEEADIRELLEAAGWTLTRNRGRKFYYLRPGGEQQWSGEYDDDKRLFYVWTTSSEFVSEKAYSASKVLSILRFGGDYSAAAKWLITQGYGEQASAERRETVSREIAKSKISTAEDDDDYSFLADEEEMEKYCEAWRNGTFQMGLTTGWKSLDRFFLFKRGYFDIFNGLDNVGKSTTLWYLAILSAMYHNWSWVIISMENRNGAVRKKLIEFYWGIAIAKQTPEQYAEAKKFIADHFTIIKNEELYNFQDMMNICDKVNRKKKHDGMLVDPYNGLAIALSETSKLSTHEYHYEGASRMQQFTKKRDTCIYLNCHVNTEAARNPTQAPGKAHTEGGSKFANKADDFATLHRHTNDPERWTKTEFHVRKVKEMETGGGYTPFDQPFILEMLPGGCGFKALDIIGDPNAKPLSFAYKNPVEEWHKSHGVITVGASSVEETVAPQQLQPNTDFLNINPLVPEESRPVHGYKHGDDLPF